MARPLLILTALAMAGCGSFADLDGLEFQDGPEVADGGPDMDVSDESDTSEADIPRTDAPDTPDAVDVPDTTADADADAGQDVDDASEDADAGPDADVDSDVDPDVPENDCPECARVYAGPSARSMCATQANSLFCWGDNAHAQLGDPARHLARYQPTAVVGVAGPTQVTAGDGHTCAVNDSDILFCWGDNEQSQLGVDSPTTSSPMSTLTSASSPSAGGQHTCAIRPDGVYCWGANRRGQTGAPREPGTPHLVDTPALVNASRNSPTVHAGSGFTCMKTVTDLAVCWGDNDRGQVGTDPGGTPCPRGQGACTSVPYISSIRDTTYTIATGAEHGCLIAETGVHCWGSNDFGQVAPSAMTPQFEALAVDVPRVNEDSKLAAGAYHNCAINEDDHVYCWGNNDHGQSAMGLAGTIRTPTLQQDLGRSSHVAGGESHTCAITSDSNVWCWGDNREGQLGVDPARDSESRVPVDTGVDDATGITAGRGHTCAISRDEVLCWGSNQFGQLGDGVPLSRSVPYGVPTGHRFEYVEVGGTHACGLADGGKVFCWGSGNLGALGLGPVPWASSPTEVPFEAPVRSLAVGSEFTCAVTIENDMFCWGLNHCGQLGTETLEIVARTPQQVDGTWMEVDAGEAHACAINENGRVLCWGANGLDQIGTDGSDLNCGEPAWSSPRATSVEAQSLGLGRWHSCAIDTDGKVVCWGADYAGQLGDGVDRDDTSLAPVNTGLEAVAVEGGEVHTCALDAEGAVHCWGLVDGGMIGTMADDLGCEGSCQLSPVRVTGLSEAVDLTVGARWTCAGHADGKINCWGQNGAGQLGVGDHGERLRPTPVELP